MAAESTARPVVVGIDGSQAALGAARWAADYAAITGSRVQLAYALPAEDWYMPLGRAVLINDRALRDELRETGASHLRHAEGLVRTVAPSAQITTTISDDDIVAFVRKHSSAAKLVVIGSRRSGPLRDMLLGSHVVAIANASQCPVVAWRQSESDGDVPPTDVVVGIDGSEHADRALRAAFDHADTTGARVIVTHFWQVSALVGIGYGGALIDWEKLRDDGTAWLRDHIAGVRERYPDVEVRFIYGDAAPARGLTNLTVAAGLVVVGSRGRGAAAGAVLGSVSQNLLHHAHCPVLVVH